MSYLYTGLLSTLVVMGGNKKVRIVERGTCPCYCSCALVHKYREMFDDFKTKDSEIVKKIEYLRALSGNIVRDNLKKYE